MAEIPAVVVVGSVNIDDIFHVQHVVRTGETIASQKYTRLAGGKGANQAVAASLAGVKTYHCGKIGEDGRWLLDKLNGFNVDTSLMQVDTTQATGRALIQVDAHGDNAIVLLAGANHTFSDGDVDRIFSLPIAATNNILLLQNEINNLPFIIQSGKNKGMQIVFNAAPMSSSVLMLPLHLVDLLVVNEIEARELAKSESLQLQEILQILIDKYPQLDVVLTLGEKGVWGAYRPDSDRLKPHQFVQVPAFPVQKIVETTGAGDTFTGYFVAARLVRKLDFLVALEIAAEAAALAVQHPGAMDSIPSRHQLTQSNLLADLLY